MPGDVVLLSAGDLVGFVPLPLSFFGLLAALVGSYLLMVEGGGEQWFYRRIQK